MHPCHGLELWAPPALSPLVSVRFLGVALANLSPGLIHGAPGQEPPTGRRRPCPRRCCRVRGVPKNLLPPWAARLAPRGLPKLLSTPGCSVGRGGLSPSSGRSRGHEGRCDPRSSGSPGDSHRPFGRGQSCPSALSPPQRLGTAAGWRIHREHPDPRARSSGDTAQDGQDQPVPHPAGSPGPCPRSFPCSIPKHSALCPEQPRGCHGPVAPGQSSRVGTIPCRVPRVAEPGWGSHVWPLHAPGWRHCGSGDTAARPG